MRNVLAGAMVITMALCLVIATALFGAVAIEDAVFVYGLAMLLALGWAAKLFFGRVVSWKYSPVHVPVLAFLAYATVRYFTSPIEYESRLMLFQIGLCALIYFLAASNFHRPRDRTILLVCLMVLAALEATYGLWQFFTKATTVLHLQRPLIYQGRAGGTFVCPNHLAGFLEMVLGLVLARIALHRSSKGSMQRSTLGKIFMAYVALLVLAGILATLSRAGWVATVIGMLTFLFWGEWRGRTIWSRLIVGMAGLCVFGFLAYNVQPVRAYIAWTLMGSERDAAITLKDPDLGGRTLMWRSSLRIIQDYPLWGTGGGTWQWFHPQYRDPRLQTHPEFAHNDILQLGSEYGLVGFALVVWVVIGFYRHAVRFTGHHNSSEQRAFAVGSVIAVTAILAHSWFDFNLHVPANALLWITLIGFTVAMEDGEGRYPRVELAPRFKYALATALVLVTAAGAWLVVPTALAARHVFVGTDYKEVLDWNRALAHFQRAIKLDPKYPEPYAKIGDIYRVQAEFRRDPARQNERVDLARKAIESYRQSLRQNPRQADVVLRLAYAQELAEDMEAAQKAYDQALALDPSSALVYQRLGFFYRKLGDEKRAEAAFTKSLNLSPDNTTRLNLIDLRTKP